MMFIVRTLASDPPGLEIKQTRRTPGDPDLTDFFCLGDPDAASAAGLPVVRVHDGWYQDDTGGGVAIWGQGMFWEVRDTPFDVREAAGPEAWPAEMQHGQDAMVNVRQAIFRG
jgi:hypothetical protein